MSVNQNPVASPYLVSGLASEPMPRSVNVTQLLKELIQIGIALTSERDLNVLLERMLLEARQFTNAEGGTLYLSEGNQLQFAVVQNDLLTKRLGKSEMRRRLQDKPLPISETSLAGYVALSGKIINLPDAYGIPAELPYTFDRESDTRNDYRTQSVLVVPLQEPSGKVIGVLQLINALHERNKVVPFDSDYEDLVRSLASQAAVALRNIQLEDLSSKDPLTDVYNRRHLMLRIDEETYRHKRFGQPVSLVIIDLDRFKEINDQYGHRAGDEVLIEFSQLLLKHSRSFAVISRYGGDEFALLLVNTAKAGAMAYAQRIKETIEQHVFRYGSLTASLGVASLPEDVTSGTELIPAADKALYEAKRLGRNRVETLNVTVSALSQVESI